MGKLRRPCASYWACDPAISTSFDPPILRRLLRDMQADIATLSGTCADLMVALRLAESFMAGFEDDELQDGINARLAAVRNAIAAAEGIH